MLEPRPGFNQTLIVATSKTPDSARAEIARQLRPRIDYLELAERLAARSIDYDEVPQGNRLTAFASGRLRLDIGQARYVNEIAREQNVDLVFSMSERVAIPLALTLPRRVRHVVNAHHLMSRHKLRLLRAAKIPSRWDLILVYGEAEARALRNILKVDETRVAWLPDKIDTRFWAPQPSDGPEHIFSIGLSYRDYPTLLAAMKSLPGVRGRLHLGNNWVQALGVDGERSVPENVTISSDHLPATDVRKLYARSRLAVVPLQQSTLWNAGSNAILEAQAMGIPVVATRTPGSMSYVLHGETGLLVEPGSPHAMAEAVRLLWDDPDRARRMGARARKWVEGNFALDDWFDKVVPILYGSPRPAPILRT